MQKQKLYVKYLKLKTIESEKTYKVYKNLFNKLIKKKTKKNFYIKHLSKCQGNTKRSWQITMAKSQYILRDKPRMNSTLSLRM